MYIFSQRDIKSVQDAHQKPDSLKKSIEEHFSRLKIFLLNFYKWVLCQTVRKLFGRSIVIQKKWLYKISSFYEKRIDTTEDYKD